MLRTSRAQALASDEGFYAAYYGVQEAETILPETRGFIKRCHQGGSVTQSPQPRVSN